MFSQIRPANSEKTFDPLNPASRGFRPLYHSGFGQGINSLYYRERVHFKIFLISPSPIVVDPTISCIWGCPGRRRDKFKRGSSVEEISPGGAPTNQSQSEWGSQGRRKTVLIPMYFLSMTLSLPFLFYCKWPIYSIFSGIQTISSWLKSWRLYQTVLPAKWCNFSLLPLFKSSISRSERACWGRGIRIARYSLDPNAIFNFWPFVLGSVPYGIHTFVYRIPVKVFYVLRHWLLHGM